MSASWLVNPRGHRIMKHVDRPLPVWGLILDCMRDGRFYTRRTIVDLLQQRWSVPEDSVRAKLKQWCYGKGYVRRLPYPASLLTMRQSNGPCDIPSQYVYQIQPEGLQALAAVKAKYGVE